MHTAECSSGTTQKFPISNYYYDRAQNYNYKQQQQQQQQQKQTTKYN
jgi:hypothetical protein